MTDPELPVQRLNIFALPNQTTVTFIILVCTILGVIILGASDPSPVCLWPMIVAIIFLPFRAFLAQPEHEIRRLNLESARDKYKTLQQAITEESVNLKLTHCPQLLVTPKSGLGAYTFGSFRHWYISMSMEEANRWEEGLLDSENAPAIHARLLHELYHFKLGDFWQLGYARQLLLQTLLVVSWTAAFLTGLILLMIVAGRAILALNIEDLMHNQVNQIIDIGTSLDVLFPSPQEMEILRQKANSIQLSSVLFYVLSALLPLVLTTGLLWLFYYRKLWRTREYYADAGVMLTQGDDKPLISSLLDIPFHLVKTSGIKASDIFDEDINANSRFNIWNYSVGNLPRLFDFHPKPVQRLGAVNSPVIIYNSWFDSAVMAGSLVLILDILLVSPLTIMIFAQWPMHFTVLITLITVGLNYIIPITAMGKLEYNQILKIVSVVTIIRLLWLLPTLLILWGLLAIAPGYLADLLNTAAASAAHFAGYGGTGYSDVTSFVIRASIINLAQVGVIFLILVSGLGIMAALTTRVFTWYKTSDRKTIMHWVYWSIIVIICLFGFVVLPIITQVLLQTFDLFSPIFLFAVVGGMLFLIIFGLLFYINDARFAHHCLQCDHEITGKFILYKSCPSCGRLIFPWLYTHHTP